VDVVLGGADVRLLREEGRGVCVYVACTYRQCRVLYYVMKTSRSVCM
jgi:hypothetical protein